ncbi:TPA: hypothetical protein ACHHA7_002877 [Staphylococcus aureus]|nr:MULTISPECIES: hypothetical protein [Staphylococcus]SCU54342.1 Uncharacterised protein [Staphylococcus aureus]HCY0820954.1 hypothetical protein [Staphylococcus aureus]HDG8540863.1 hypothetical protein [Staphylococcus aureus]HDJ2073056.1 hypothetical protein [Staphylococcus aureus]
MSEIPNNLQNLEDSIKINNVELFESFDIESFLNGKILAVEKVVVDSHIKLELRIVKDRTLYNDETEEDANKNKIITAILHKDIANSVNIVDIIGNEVYINNINPDDALVYGINCLQVTVKDIEIRNHKIEGFEQRTSFTKADYRLMKMNLFKTFNSNKFISSYRLKLLTVYPQNPTTARALILITEDLTNVDSSLSNVGKTFSLKVELSNVRDIPLEFVIGNKDIDRNNILGNLSGMTVKNNQVLLTADKIQINDNGNNIIIGKGVSKDASNHINSNVSNNENNIYK